MSKEKMSPTQKTLMLVTCGMLVALDVVLTRFASVNLWDKRIGFSFVAVGLAAYLYGPIGGAVVHGLSDFIGALVFPYGPYFPGYTLTAMVIGLVFGLCFYRSTKVWRIALGVVGAQAVGSILLNTLWIAITNHTPYFALLPGRLIQASVMVPVQLVVLPLVVLVAEKAIKPLLKAR